MSKNPLLIFLAGILLLAALPGCDYFIIGDTTMKPVPTSTATLEEIIGDIEPDQVDLSRATATANPPTDAEKADVLYMREEEKLARDVYTKLNEKWKAQTFANIIPAEQSHMDLVKKLIDAFGLRDPGASAPGEFTSPEFARLYTQLVTRGSASLVDAYAVGAYIEELDIKDLEERIERAYRLDIIHTFGSLANGSRSHLRAFVTQLKAQGVTYTPQVLSATAYDRIINPPK
jgi:hypothetical protein